MLTHLFYLATLFFIHEEWSWIVNPREKAEDLKRFAELKNQNKGKKSNEYSEEYKSVLKSKYWLLIPFFWMFIGLFSSQWVAFLLIILFNAIIISPLSRLTKYSTEYVVLHWVNSMIGFLFGAFVIVNHYYLKINLTDLLLSFIK